MTTFPFARLRLALRNAAAAACLCLAALASGTAVSPAHALTGLRFSLDRRVDGAATPFLLAASRGLFRNEGLAVETDAAVNSQEAIERVASGARDMALADFGALLRYRARPDAAPVKAVYVYMNRTGYAIVARKSRGIATLGDLAGKTLGATDGDLNLLAWPSLAKANGVDPTKIAIEKIGVAVREPMLIAGQIDAATSLAITAPVNLRDRGIPASDMVLFRYADLGSALYGHVVIVNPAFATNQADAVRGYLRALTQAIKATVKEPARALDEVLPQIENAGRDVELERLRVTLRDHVATDDVKRNGLGAVTEERFLASVDEIAATVKFTKPPALGDIIDDAFLPPPPLRKLN